MLKGDAHDGKHPCPKVGCEEWVPFGQMACRPHWFSLPEELRNRVNKVWRGGWVDEILAARKEVLAVLNGTVEVVE